MTKPQSQPTMHWKIQDCVWITVNKKISYCRNSRSIAMISIWPEQWSGMNYSAHAESKYTGTFAGYIGYIHVYRVQDMSLVLCTHVLIPQKNN